MANGIPTATPRTRTLDWAAYVRKVWGDEWHKKEVVYKFSTGREYRDSGAGHGIYTGTGA